MEDKLKQELEKQREEIVKQLEEWHSNGYFEINGRRYEISKLSHQFRIEVLAVYSQIEPQILLGNYGFLTDENVKRILKKIDEKILFEGMQISKRPQHWEEYAEDYLDYIAISMKVICYPFYKKKLLTS